MSLKNLFTSFFDTLSDVKSYFDFDEEQLTNLISEKYFNSLRGKDSFNAVILRLEKERPAQKAFRSTSGGKYLIVKVRPIDLHDFILPHPANPSLTAEEADAIIDLHPSAISDFVAPANRYAVGDVVECYFEEQGPQFEGLQRGPRFRQHIVSRKRGLFNFNYSKTSSNSSKSSFGKTPAKLLGNKASKPLEETPPPPAEPTVPTQAGKCDEIPYTYAADPYKKYKGEITIVKKGWCLDSNTKGSKSNFHKVAHAQNYNLYRSARPKQDVKVFEMLKKEYGIERVLTLDQAEYKGSKTKALGRVGDAVKATYGDENFKRVSLGSSPPSSKEWREIKEFLKKGNVLIHCKHGADRTGAIIAKFQIEVLGKDAKAMHLEAMPYGFKPVDHPGYGKGPDPNRKLREWYLPLKRSEALKLEKSK